MKVIYIVVAYEAHPGGRCLGTVASATSMEQAQNIVKTFAYVALAQKFSALYVIRDVSSASLYGPECQVNLLSRWRLDYHR